MEVTKHQRLSDHSPVADPVSVRGGDVRAMFGSIARRYDLTNSVLSFGIHHYWRQRLVRMITRSENSLVLDVCTGTADLVPLLCRRFGRVVGLDFCRPMLVGGLQKIKTVGPRAIGLIQGDALGLPFEDATFDIVSVAFGVRNFEDIDRGLKELFRVLKPNGSLLVLEFGKPRNVLWAWSYAFYAQVIMPLVGGLLTGNRQAYEYLPQTAQAFPCGRLFEDRLGQAGFSATSCQPLTGGIAYAYSAIK